jgi:hypothetical protein
VRTKSVPSCNQWLRDINPNWVRLTDPEGHSLLRQLYRPTNRPGQSLLHHHKMQRKQLQSPIRQLRHRQHLPIRLRSTRSRSRRTGRRPNRSKMIGCPHLRDGSSLSGNRSFPNKTMEATANSDQLIDVVYLVGLVCLVSLAVVVLRIAWIALFKERKKPDRSA